MWKYSPISPYAGNTKENGMNEMNNVLRKNSMNEKESYYLKFRNILCFQLNYSPISWIMFLTISGFVTVHICIFIGSILFCL